MLTESSVSNFLSFFSFSSFFLQTTFATWSINISSIYRKFIFPERVEGCILIKYWIANVFQKFLYFSCRWGSHEDNLKKLYDIRNGKRFKNLIAKISSSIQKVGKLCLRLRGASFHCPIRRLRSPLADGTTKPGLPAFCNKLKILASNKDNYVKGNKRLLR